MAYGTGTRSKGRNLRARQRGNYRSDEILEAALLLFSERGYTAVSIKEIAQVSGINSALIYYYFASKDQLFVEALKYSAHVANLHHLQASAHSEDPVAAINRWFDTNGRMAKPLGQMVRLMLDFRMSHRRSASVERLIKDFYEAEVSLLLRNIAEGIKIGVFRAVDVEQTALFVSTHLDGLMVASSVRVNYDLQSGFRHMRKVLFAWLGYGVANDGKTSRAKSSRSQAAA